MKCLRPPLHLGVGAFFAQKCTYVYRFEKGFCHNLSSGFNLAYEECAKLTLPTAPLLFNTI